MQGFGFRALGFRVLGFAAFRVQGLGIRDVGLFVQGNMVLVLLMEQSKVCIGLGPVSPVYVPGILRRLCGCC